MAILVLGGVVFLCINKYQDNGILQEQERLLQEVSRDIVNGGFSRIEVFYLPLALETPVRVAPEILFDSSPAARIHMNTHEAERIQVALKKTTVYSYSGEADVRVGFVVYDVTGNRKLNVSIDPFNNGYVNGIPSHFKGNLKKVLIEIGAPSKGPTGLREKVYDFLLKHR